jgi:flagellar biosynthesis protein
MKKDTNSKYPDMHKTAVALEYNSFENAPRIIASGKGYLAEKITKTAQEENIPIHKDEKLSASLSTLSIGDMIPPELYGVVAEVLTFVDDMDKLKRKLDLD